MFAALLLTGIVILACLLAIAGYTLVHVSWRLKIRHAVRQRHTKRLNDGKAQAPISVSCDEIA